MFHSVLSTSETQSLPGHLCRTAHSVVTSAFAAFFYGTACMGLVSCLHKTLEIFDEMTMFSLVLLFTCLFTLMYS